MREELIRFDGMFQWWMYTVSHGHLLLRRTKTASMPTRVDLLFLNVKFIHLVTLLWNPIVYRVTSDSIPPTVLANVPMGDYEVYLLHTTEFDGYIVAGNMVWHEDDLEYDDPSPLHQLGINSGGQHGMA
jgi:hypothetical protein